MNSLVNTVADRNSRNSEFHSLLFKGIVFILFILILLSPSTAFNGVKNGLTLWIDIIFPGLFMAMIVTGCIMQLFKSGSSSSYFYIVLCGILCGYPIGSMLCADLHKKIPNEKLTEKIIAYCNISGPSFVLNYILKQKCFENISRIKIICCIYIPAVISILFIFLINYIKNRKRKQSLNNPDISYVPSVSGNQSEKSFEIIDNAIWNAMESMLKLGGYIIVFSTVLSYIMGIYISLPSAELTEIFLCLKAAICCTLEITNGISFADTLNIAAEFKAVLIITANAFGGLSTVMQTVGMINGSGLKIKKYIYHKIIFALITALNTILIIYVL